jgi:NhaP-type Na+/H+ or K+/H+ antiporter
MTLRANDAMATKHLLTVFHSLMAVVVTTIGWLLAGQIADQKPIMAVVAGIAAIIIPVAIATRVAWTAGYAAGSQAPTRHQHSNSSM